MSRWTESPSPIPFCKALQSGRLRVIVGREPVGPNGSMRWHMSISRNDRYPNWNEIRDARYELVPDDVTMAMLLPPKSDYVNIHTNCFHLHELED